MFCASGRHFAKNLAAKPAMSQEEIDRMFGVVDPFLEEPEQGQESTWLCPHLFYNFRVVHGYCRYVAQCLFFFNSIKYPVRAYPVIGQ